MNKIANYRFTAPWKSKVPLYCPLFWAKVPLYCPLVKMEGKIGGFQEGLDTSSENGVFMVEIEEIIEPFILL